MLVSELPNARLLEASSLIELRVAPRRLTAEIAGFAEQCWRPRAARSRPRVLNAEFAATLTPRMSSRQEEKERRKRERQEREARREGVRRPPQAHAARLRRRARRPSLVARVVGSPSPRRRRRRRGRASPRAPRPSRRSRRSDLKKAAAAAGCTLVDPPNEGAGHEEKEFKPSDYKPNPPTSGNHFPVVPGRHLRPGDTPELGKLVHTLEHGRIDVQYKPGTPGDDRRQLETFIKENEDGYHMLLFENGTRCRSRWRRPRGTTSSAARP